MRPTPIDVDRLDVAVTAYELAELTGVPSGNASESLPRLEAGDHSVGCTTAT